MGCQWIQDSGVDSRSIGPAAGKQIGSDPLNPNPSQDQETSDNVTANHDDTLPHEAAEVAKEVAGGEQAEDKGDYPRLCRQLCRG